MKNHLAPKKEVNEVETETPEEKKQRKQRIQEFERSQMKRLRVPEWRILLALAYNGPQSRYQISKKYNFKYPIVHRATKSLKEIRWVEAIEEKLSVKNRPTKIYGLTRKGLLWLLSKIPKTIHPSLVDFSESDSLVLRKAMEEKDISKVENLKTQNDVYLHLLWESDVDRIAGNNTNLFPLIFENWDFYKEIEVAQHFVSEMPETAFSTLVDYYYEQGDLLEARKHKFSTLDLFFPYKLYYTYLKMVTEADPVFLDEKELRQQAIKVFRKKQQLKDLFKILSSQIEDRTAENFQFIKNLRSEMSKH